MSTGSTFCNQSEGGVILMQLFIGFRYFLACFLLWGLMGLWEVGCCVCGGEGRAKFAECLLDDEVVCFNILCCKVQI